MAETKKAAPVAEDMETAPVAEDMETAPVAEDMEELVDYLAPLVNLDNPRDVVVAVNGETIRIKRGEPVKIKRKFVEVLNNAQDQEIKAWRMMQQAQKDSAEALANL